MWVMEAALAVGAAGEGVEKQKCQGLVPLRPVWDAVEPS